MMWWCVLCPFQDPSFVFFPSSGRSGGILLVWNSRLWHKVDVFVGVYSVSSLVKDVRTNSIWVATSVYGPNQSMYRSAFSGELSTVAERWHCPWVLGGDFNVIRFSLERKGGCPIFADVRAFSDWIRHQELVDLPLDGARYTWTNC